MAQLVPYDNASYLGKYYDLFNCSGCISCFWPSTD